MINFERVKKAVIGEIQFRAESKLSPMGECKIYRMVIDELAGNQAAADRFMLSHGGFTRGELGRIKRIVLRYTTNNANRKSRSIPEGR